MEPNSIFLRDRNKQSKKDNFDYDNIEPQLHNFRDIHTVTQLITAKEHTHKRGCLTHAIWSIKVFTASLQPLTLQTDGLTSYQITIVGAVMIRYALKEQDRGAF